MPNVDADQNSGIDLKFLLAMAVNSAQYLSMSINANPALIATEKN